MTFLGQPPAFRLPPIATGLPRYLDYESDLDEAGDLEVSTCFTVHASRWNFRRDGWPAGKKRIVIIKFRPGFYMGERFYQVYSSFSIRIFSFFLFGR